MTLIRLRKQEEAFRSLHFHFPNWYDNPRCAEYIKLDEKGQKVEALLNCSEEDVEIEKAREILFCRNYENGILRKKGHSYAKWGRGIFKNSPSPIDVLHGCKYNNCIYNYCDVVERRVVL